MVTLHEGPHFLFHGEFLPDCPTAREHLAAQGVKAEEIDRADAGSMARRILSAHSECGGGPLYRLRFDALVSPDNNYVSILQTARAAGLTAFPMPYVLTNCHNSYCAVGGTANEDDHRFGLSCAKKYGGIFVPRFRGVLHQYIRETMAGHGKMILGSDSHTRYGALGTLGIGEGGGELVKQLLGRPYDLPRPPVVAVRLTGRLRPGVGPMDAALAFSAAVFKNGFVKNKILEFTGEGIAPMSVETRMGIDVMTTEAGALSSIWQTDERVKAWLSDHGRPEDYAPLSPAPLSRYDALITIDLSQVEPMIALPFHPSNAYPIRTVVENGGDILRALQAEGERLSGAGFQPPRLTKEGRLKVDQALVSGCSGGLFENLCAVRDVLNGYTLPGDGPSLSVNPASLPVSAALGAQGVAADLMQSGVTIYPPGCGCCFGVTDVPASGQFSVRHVTRNYPGREGAQKALGQSACVALMDARSIAVTIRRGGALTAATELDVSYRPLREAYDPEIYPLQVYRGFGHPQPDTPVALGPGIADWPAMDALPEHLVLQVTGAFEGSITTDDLIPSGEASSHRSDPSRIAEYLLIGRDGGYVARAKALRAAARGEAPLPEAVSQAVKRLRQETGAAPQAVGIGGLLCADALGDGSSREQAASSQRVLGGLADLAHEYATKRYRSNLINWGLLPLTAKTVPPLSQGDVLALPSVRKAVASGAETLTVWPQGRKEAAFEVSLGALTAQEREILLAGCVINQYAGK